MDELILRSSSGVCVGVLGAASIDGIIRVEFWYIFRSSSDAPVRLDMILYEVGSGEI
jgi:hypothetical protein